MSFTLDRRSDPRHYIGSAERSTTLGRYEKSVLAKMLGRFFAERFRVLRRGLQNCGEEVKRTHVDIIQNAGC